MASLKNDLRIVIYHWFVSLEQEVVEEDAWGRQSHLDTQSDDWLTQLPSRVVFETLDAAAALRSS